MALELTPLFKIPLISRGDHLPIIILQALTDSGIQLEDHDVLVVTQKIVSKSEGRVKELSKVRPTTQAIALAAATEKDPRLVELMLQESHRVLGSNSRVIIVEDKKGFVCADAGIDLSNVDEQNVETARVALLLPLNADHSACEICREIMQLTNKRIGVLIIDSQGRPWRKGTIGTAIGICGLPALIDVRGQKDLFGRVERDAQIAVADELASAASLLMGETNEGSPVVHVRGFPYELRQSSINEILRPKDKEVFD